MAQDRFVCFRGEAPSYKDIKCVLEDYLKGLVLKIDFGKGRSKSKETEFWSILLPGKPSFPFKRLMRGRTMGAEIHKERWFEVVVSRKGKKVTDIDVITRLSDEITGVIADGFVALCQRYWKAKVTR